jgi:hypothetical protein
MTTGDSRPDAWPRSDPVATGAAPFGVSLGNAGLPQAFELRHTVDRIRLAQRAIVASTAGPVEELDEAAVAAAGDEELHQRCALTVERRPTIVRRVVTGRQQFH